MAKRIKQTYSIEAPDGQIITETTSREVAAAVLVFVGPSERETPDGINEGRWSLFSVSKNSALAEKTIRTWQKRQPSWVFRVAAAKLVK